MGVSREARAHRVLVLARDVFPGPGNPTGPPAKMAVSGVFGRPTIKNDAIWISVQSAVNITHTQSHTYSYNCTIMHHNQS